MHHYVFLEEKKTHEVNTFISTLPGVFEENETDSRLRTEGIRSIVYSWKFILS